jgi:hypothetical protein
MGLQDLAFSPKGGCEIDLVSLTCPEKIHLFYTRSFKEGCLFTYGHLRILVAH